MKKIFSLLVLLSVALLVNAQQKDNSFASEISVDLGTSYLGSTTNLFVKGSLVKKAYATPVMMLSYTYRFNEYNFGLGANGSYQLFHFDLFPLDSSRNGLIANVNKLNFSLHAEYYAVNKSNFNLYLGLGLGVSIWSAKASFEDLASYTYDLLPPMIADYVIAYLPLSDLRFYDTFISYQLYMGMNYYFVQNVGIKAELAIGSPYYSRLGLTVRF